MLSRIADSLFWLNRYMERADGLLRETATHYILSLDKAVNVDVSWRPVLETFTSAEEAEIAAIQNNTEEVLKRILIDPTNHNSLRAIVSRARENARGVQDHITKEVWEQVNHVFHLINQPTLINRLNGYEALEVIDSFTRQSVMYTGVTDITMPRGMGWCFMNLGRYVERCLETLEMVDKEFSLIDYNMNDARDIMQWRSLLLSLSGYELHLKTYRSNNYNNNVMHQVLFNEHFTRSVLYSLSRIDKYLKEVLVENSAGENTALMHCFGRLYSKARYIDMDSLDGLVLQKFLEEVKDELLNFSMRLGQSFFSYS